MPFNLLLLITISLPAIYESFSTCNNNKQNSCAFISKHCPVVLNSNFLSRRKSFFSLFSFDKPVSHDLKANVLNKVAVGLLLSLGTALLDSRAVNAVQGTIKPSSIEEAKAAAAVIQKCLKRMTEIDALAKEGNYDDIGKILATSDFQSIESASTVLVRSDALSADEKVALGTIKRYGLVADALIMLGGLSAELKAGGIDYTPKTPTLQQSIEDDEDDTSGSDEIKSVNGAEVRKYIGLSKGSLQDIFKIVQPILNK